MPKKPSNKRQTSTVINQQPSATEELMNEGKEKNKTTPQGLSAEHSAESRISPTAAVRALLAVATLSASSAGGGGINLLRSSLFVVRASSSSMFNWWTIVKVCPPPFSQFCPFYCRSQTVPPFSRYPERYVEEILSHFHSTGKAHWEVVNASHLCDQYLESCILRFTCSVCYL